MLYIMRHGESTVNVERRLTCLQFEGDLTPLGRTQAEKAGRWLADKGITQIYSSPFHRALETAGVVSDALGIEVSTDDGLREIDCGELEGRSDDEAWDLWRASLAGWKAREWDSVFPGGETFRRGYERFSESLRHASMDGNALLVTHGAISLTIVPCLCVNAAALHRIHVLANSGMALLDRYDEGRYICESWNLVEHLR